MSEVHYPYSPIIRRAPFRWPDDQRLAVVITINTESWDLLRPTSEIVYAGPGILPDPLPGDVPDWPNYTWREYGHRVGYWRIMEILDRHGVRSSSTINAQVGEKYPEMIEEGLKRGWEFLAHGYEQGTLLTRYAHDPAAERAVIRDVIERYTAQIGYRPRGWLSSACRFTMHTAEILADEGFLFHADYLNDDQPYVMDIGGRPLVAVPYSFEINDYMVFYRRNFTPDEWLTMLQRQFDVLYDEASRTGSGRLMNVGLHPHVIGVPFRAPTIDAFLAYAKERDGVFFPTREDIATWCLRQAGTTSS